MPLRVIAGSAGGLHLKSPKRHELRPTQDRIRQVIFSSLAERVPGTQVLDLYAGTGAIGIEALSRGAASAVFVEQNREAAECIRENLLHCHLTGDVQNSDVDHYLSGPPVSFDLIFADPPYDKTRKTGTNLPLLGKIEPFLAKNGVLIWEHYTEQRFSNLSGWTIIRFRSYGETSLTFLEKDVKSNLSH